MDGIQVPPGANKGRIAHYVGVVEEQEAWRAYCRIKSLMNTGNNSALLPSLWNPHFSRPLSRILRRLLANRNCDA